MKKKVITVIMTTLMLCSSVGEMVYADVVNTSETADIVDTEEVNTKNVSDDVINDQSIDELKAEDREVLMNDKDIVGLVENTELQDCDLVVEENVSTGIEEFVTGLYENILERDADEFGFANWTNKLRSGTITANQAIYNFFICSEYQNKNKGVEAFVNDLYKGALGREADEEGKRNWIDSINIGSNAREDVLVFFLNSEEFFNRVQDINKVAPANQKMLVGYFDTDFDFEGQKDIIEIVSRFYKIGLEREPDFGGFYNWTRNIMEREITIKEMARGFIFSEEFRLKNGGKSKGEFIDVFYKLLFNRDADADGKAGWLNVIGESNPMDKLEELAQGFFASEEFADLYNYYSETDDAMPVTIAELVKKVYKTKLGRKPSKEELTDWIDRLQSGELTANQAIYDLFMSSEYQSKYSNLDDFITDLYVYLWGREPDSDEIDSWNGSDERNELLGYFLNKEDFFNRVYEYNSVAVSNQKILVGCFFVDSDFDAQIQVTKFVTRFYQKGLNREIDYEGGTDWMKKILWNQITPDEFVRGIVYSSEFRNLHSKDSKEDFVEFCYELFFNRPSDEGGKANWLNVIGDANPMDKLNEVAQGFIGSQEFINVCNSFIDA